MTEAAADRPIDQAAVDRLHDRILEALNDPAGEWHRQPQAAAATVAGVLANVLRHVAETDPRALPWIKNLLVGITDIVVDAVKPATVPIGTGPMRWH